MNPSPLPPTAEAPDRQVPAASLEGLSPSLDDLARIEPATASVHARILAPYLRRPDLAQGSEDPADALHYVAADVLADLVDLQAVEVLKLRHQGHSVLALADLSVQADPPPCAACPSPIGLRRLLFCSDACKFRVERRRKAAALAVMDAQDAASSYRESALQAENLTLASEAFGLRLDLADALEQVTALVDLLGPVAHLLPVPLPEVSHDAHT